MNIFRRQALEVSTLLVANLTQTDTNGASTWGTFDTPLLPEFLSTLVVRLKMSSILFLLRQIDSQNNSVGATTHGLLTDLKILLNVYVRKLEKRGISIGLFLERISHRTESQQG